MNNTVENDFFSISQGTVATSDRRGGQSVRFPCQIFSGIHMPKITKIGKFLTVIQKIKGGCFWDKVYIHIQAKLVKFLKLTQRTVIL